MNKLYKNFILCGDIDHYCLLCKESFRGISDVEKHVRWEKHRTTMRNQDYFPKFRKNCIYKVANNFYCELCNFVASDVATVTSHINTEDHKALKMDPTKAEAKKFIGQFDSGYIIIKKVIISIGQWNSIIKKKCLLCNVDVQNENDHMGTEDHILKLFQSETKYEDDRYFRKINEDTYHCFTCKKLFTAQNFNDHWPTCENIDEIEIKNLKKVKSTSASLTEDITKMAEIEKQLIGTLEEFYLIDETNNNATCKYCATVVAINFKSMIEHMKYQHNNQGSAKHAGSTDPNSSDESVEDEVVYREITDYGKKRSELSQYGKKHSIKLNYKGARGWCLLCDLTLPAHKNNFKQHIKSAIHRGHLELQGLKKPKKKHSDRNFESENILKFQLQYSPKHNQFWIDRNFRCDVYSFFLLRKIDDPHFNKTKCYACSEMFTQGQEREHCETQKHKDNFLAAKYITSMRSSFEPPEFIREIRENLFHCGYCNRTFPFLEVIHIHTETPTHESMVEAMTEGVADAVDVQHGTDDVYMKLVQYAFGNI